MKKTTVVLAAMLVLCFTALVGCSKKVVKEEVAAETTAAEKAKAAEVAKERDREQIQDLREETEVMAVEKAQPARIKDELTRMAEEEGRLTPIYFDFDRFTIRDDAKPVLERIAGWLKEHRDVNVRIHGHCDERGTNEYNLALGERRAESTRRYLVDLGIKPARLSTISYGEENPVCGESRESCWSKNRRAEFELIK